LSGLHFAVTLYIQNLPVLKHYTV